MIYSTDTFQPLLSLSRPTLNTQTMSVMLISIAKCDKWLSVSDIVGYICSDLEKFDKLFEIIDERISSTMLSMKDDDCKVAALEFTLSVMTVSPNNIHSNVFTEHLLTNHFHRVLFKYLKYEIRGIHQEHIALRRQQQRPSVIAHHDANDGDKGDEIKENEKEEDVGAGGGGQADDGGKEEFTMQCLRNKQPLLMLVLCNIVTLSHYQRFETDNVALKWLGGMKVLPTSVSCL